MADEKTFTKAELDAAVAAATGKLQESIDKLETKTAALLDEKKTAERKLRAASEIKPEDLTAAEERADRAEAALAEAQKQVGALTKERDKVVKALETESAFTQQLLIQDGLKSALIEAGVKDADYLDMAIAKLSSGASVKIDGDKREAMIGDKPLADAIKEWAGTDAGKKVVSAANNSGGGAGGGDNKGAAPKTMLRSAFDALPPADQHAFTVKDGGKVVDVAA